MTIAAVADTHGFLWYGFNDGRLSPAAKSFIDMQRRNGDEVGVSSITLAEILYLSGKGRIPVGAFNDGMTYLERSDAAFVEVAFDRSIARSMQSVHRNDVPDMPDRIIAVTALQLGVPSISRDSRIRASNVQTIW